MNAMFNHNKKPRSNQLIDLGFLLLLYRGEAHNFNLTQPLYSTSSITSVALVSRTSGFSISFLKNLNADAK